MPVKNELLVRTEYMDKRTAVSPHTYKQVLHRPLISKFSVLL